MIMFVDPTYVEDRWDADYVNLIEKDIEYLAERYGITVTPFEVLYDDELDTIRDSLNALEQNITALVNGLDFTVEAYVEAVQYSETLPKRTDLNRWVDIIVEIYWR